MARSSSGDIAGLAQCLDRAKAWLWKAFLRTDDGQVGWGHYLGEAEPTVWGGTLDGVRAMLDLGVPPLSPDLADAVVWLRGQQRGDGGFGTRELDYSAAEATSWVLIMLARLGLTADSDQVAERATRYLEQCVDRHGGAATTPSDSDQPRTLPTALAVWALSLQPNTSHLCGLLVDRLRSTQDPDARGWGVAFGSQPNAANTAQVLHALRQAGVSADVEWMRAGSAYLIGRQNLDGSFRNSHDEWFTNTTPRIPYRCSHFATSWALLALTDFDEERSCRQAAGRAARYLISHQLPSGAWSYEEFDPAEHVWCVTQVAIALVAWKERQDPAKQARSGRGAPPVTATELAAGARKWIQVYGLYIVVAALVVGEARGLLGTVVGWTVRTLRIDRGSVWNNLLSSALWAAFVLGFGLLMKRRMRRGRK